MPIVMLMMSARSCCKTTAQHGRNLCFGANSQVLNIAPDLKGSSLNNRFVVACLCLLTSAIAAQAQPEDVPERIAPVQIQIAPAAKMPKTVAIEGVSPASVSAVKIATPPSAPVGSLPVITVNSNTVSGKLPTSSLANITIPAPNEQRNATIGVPVFADLARQRGDYFSRLRDDAKAASCYEEYLKAVESRGPQADKVEEVAKLALCYKNLRQQPKAITLLAETSRYTLNPAQIGAGFVDAALLCREVQDEAKARKYYSQAIPHYETYLRTIAHLGPQPGVVMEVINLSRCHEALLQFSQAAQVTESFEQYMVEPVIMASSYIEAARLYEQAGEVDKVQALYAKVPQVGYAWATILSYHDQAKPLIKVRKFAEAQTILSQPLYPPNVKNSVGLGREDAVLAQNVWLAQVAYEQGHMEEAMKFSQEAMRVSAVASLNEAKGIREQVRELYLKAGGWKKEPITCDIAELIIKIDPSRPDRKLYGRFNVETYGVTTLGATTDNPNMKVRILPKVNWRDMKPNTNVEKHEVIVEVSDAKKIAPIGKFNIYLSGSTPEQSISISVRIE